jgi:hypothetical protein
LDDWLKVDPQTVKDLGGSTWLFRNHFSLLRALQEVYPNHPWPIKEKVGQKPRGFWNVHEHRVQFVKALEVKLGNK